MTLTLGNTNSFSDIEHHFSDSRICLGIQSRKTRERVSVILCFRMSISTKGDLQRASAFGSLQFWTTVANDDFFTQVSMIGKT